VWSDEITKCRRPSHDGHESFSASRVPDDNAMQMWTCLHTGDGAVCLFVLSCTRCCRNAPNRHRLNSARIYGRACSGLRTTPLRSDSYERAICCSGDLQVDPL
jgi:hypothetical protein